MILTLLTVYLLILVGLAYLVRNKNCHAAMVVLKVIIVLTLLEMMYVAYQYYGNNRTLCQMMTDIGCADQKY
jgi:hypothetical protein